MYSIRSTDPHSRKGEMVRHSSMIIEEGKELQDSQGNRKTEKITYGLNSVLQIHDFSS